MALDPGSQDSDRLLTKVALVHYWIVGQRGGEAVLDALAGLFPNAALFADVARYANLDKYGSWAFDWVARYHGEPYWRGSAMMDLGEAARASGFVEVESRGLTAYDYPHIVIGQKP